jgi:RNA polymerase sigma-70 factor (ECF subfamily)
MIHASQLEDEGDEALAGRVRNGNAAAFAELATRHRGAVWVITRNMCATLRQAEQVLQQTFVSAWRDAGALPAGESFATGLYRSAIRNARAERQREGQKPSCSLESLLPVFDAKGGLVASQGRWTAIDEAKVEEMKISGLLREALECIDDQTRAAFVLRDLLDLPLEEAGAVLETSPAAVRREAHRARLMLRGFIDRL